MNKILYLLGAGASANALPTVEGMRSKSNSRRSISGNDLLESIQSVDDVISFLEYCKSEVPFKSSSDESNLHAAILLLQRLSFHLKVNPNQTIDNISRRWFLNKAEMYSDLKKGMNLYFNILEYIKINDYRVDVWITNILNSELKLPKNVTVLNWNYDRQIRRAIQSYNVDIEKNKAFSLNPSESDNYFGFKEYKLNGTFSSLNESLNLTNSNIVDHVIQFIGVIDLRYYQFFNLLKEDSHEIKFAWDNPNQSIHNSIIQNVSELIVIGYSFPFYNRHIDQIIINNLINSGNLKKITIVDRDNEVIKEKIDSLITSSKLKSLLKYVDIDPKINISEYPIPFGLEYPD